MADLEQLDGSVAGALAAVSQLAAQLGRGDLVKRVADEVARGGRTDPPTIVVAAEVSSGKTTLTNALVSSPELLPVDVDVATGVFVVVTYAKSPRVSVFTRDHRAPIESSLGEIADWVSVARNPGNEKGVLHVEVGVPSPLLSEGVRIIDTPGVGGLNSQHAAMTLTALAGADALLFVLDASAPLSEPELRFLIRAAEDIQTVVFALSKADLNPGWKVVLDEDRRLLKEHAPRFANHRIFPIRAPDVQHAERKRRRDRLVEAERLAERSGLPALVHHLRTAVIHRSADVRQANGYRFGLSVLAHVDDSCRQQEETLRGDKEPLERLGQRQEELAQLQTTTHGWAQQVRSRFDDLQRTLTRTTQDALDGFRAQYEEDITVRWRSQRHLSFSTELEMALRRITVELERALAEGVLATAGDAAREMGVDDLPTPEATFVVPERETLAARSVEHSSAGQSRALGALILTEVAQTLRNIVTSGGNPLSLLLAPIGLGSAIVGVVNAKAQRAQIEQTEAKRLLQEYDARFRRDAAIALDDGIRAAKEETVAALQRQIEARLQTVKAQIQTLTVQAAKIHEAEAERARVLERRTYIAELQKAFAARIQLLASPTTTTAVTLANPGLVDHAVTSDAA
jgi:signal recognition particle receptor subunit beta